MVALTTRSGKGSPLTNAELDANFNNLNSGKLEAGAFGLGVTMNQPNWPNTSLDNVTGVAAGLYRTLGTTTQVPAEMGGTSCTVEYRIRVGTSGTQLELVQEITSVINGQKAWRVSRGAGTFAAPLWDPWLVFSYGGSSLDIGDTAASARTALELGTMATQNASAVTITGGSIAAAVTYAGTAAKATVLETARTIGGVSFNGSANINLPGVNTAGNQNTSGSAASLTTARTLTIGSTGKTFNGSADVSWSLAEIGAAAASHTHSYLPLAGGTMTGTIVANFSGAIVHGYAGGVTRGYLYNDGAGIGLLNSSGNWTLRINQGTSRTEIMGDLLSASWLRTTGDTGWYSESYGGGWHMTDTTWMRLYGGKPLYVANQIAATGNITAYYSDERLKENIETIANALAAVTELDGVRYNANALAESFGYDRSKQEIGLLAGQVQAVCPEAVEIAPFDLDAEGKSKSGENYLTLKYERLVPLLVEAIKELNLKVEALENGTSKLG